MYLPWPCCHQLFKGIMSPDFLPQINLKKFLSLNGKYFFSVTHSLRFLFNWPKYIFADGFRRVDGHIRLIKLNKNKNNFISFICFWTWINVQHTVRWVSDNARRAKSEAFYKVSFRFRPGNWFRPGTGFSPKPWFRAWERIPVTCSSLIIDFRLAGSNWFETGNQRIYIYTEGTAPPFVFTTSVFCLRKPESVRKTTTELLAAVLSSIILY